MILKYFMNLILKSFFEKKADYIIPPISLPKTAKVFDIIQEKNIPVLEVSDIIDIFKSKQTGIWNNRH